METRSHMARLPQPLAHGRRVSFSLTKITEALNNSTDLAEEVIFGELRARDVPWVSMEAFSIDRIGISNDLQIHLEIAVIPDRLPKGRFWKQGPIRLAQRYQIIGNKFVGLVNTGGKAETFILNELQRLASRLAPKLFELDPRIGVSFWDCVFSKGDMKLAFPLSPIFDPPPPAPIPTTPILHMRGIAEGSTLGDRHRPDVRCPFCQLRITNLLERDEVAWWGGGNLGWVHAKCAPWITQRSNHP